MHVQVHYQGLKHTPWMDQLISRKVDKLTRYLSPSASIHVHLKQEKTNYVTTLAIHNVSHDYSFTAPGENLYESFASAIDKASRSLSEHKRQIKDKIGRRAATQLVA